MDVHAGATLAMQWRLKTESRHLQESTCECSVTCYAHRRYANSSQKLSMETFVLNGQWPKRSIAAPWGKWSDGQPAEKKMKTRKKDRKKKDSSVCFNICRSSSGLCPDAIASEVRFLSLRDTGTITLETTCALHRGRSHPPLWGKVADFSCEDS